MTGGASLQGASSDGDGRDRGGLGGGQGRVAGPAPAVVGAGRAGRPAEVPGGAGRAELGAGTLDGVPVAGATVSFILGSGVDAIGTNAKMSEYGAAIALAGRTSDHLVEATLTAVAAYGSFLLAENFHFSGVLATVAAGLLMGNLGMLREDEKLNIFSPDGRSFVIGLWEFAAFIANSLIFLLIGLRVAAMPFTGIGAKALLIAVGLVLMGRALTVYPLCLLFQHSAWAIPMRDQHVLWWGGLRGALALALALALPPSDRKSVV